MVEVRVFLLGLLTCLLVAGAAPADRDFDAEARAAWALSSVYVDDGVPTRAGLCPCSQGGGTCPCYGTEDCGCVSGAAAGVKRYRWVATSRPGHTALYLGTEQRGNWRQEEACYYRLTIAADDSSVWTRAACPVNAPSPSLVAHTSPPAYFAPTRDYVGNVGPPVAFPGYSGGPIGYGRGFSRGFGGGSCGPGG